QVSSVPTHLANQNNPNQARTDFVTYLKTTSALIKSEFVLNAALRDIKDLPTIKAQQDPIKYLDEELQVTWQDGSEVIRITFKSGEPQDAKKIVDAVQKAFMSEVVQKDVDEKRLFLKKVEDAQADIKRALTSAGDRTKRAPLTPAGGRVAGAPPGAAPAPPALLPAEINARLNSFISPQMVITELLALRRDVEKLPVTI